ncbi:MAG: hypothetical protein KDE68_08870 [Rhodocyclaceae bacterium]|nr:hypothetical protein [Rhodocyclaceae bacterium]
MNQTKFAQMLGCTPQRISQYKEMGMPGVSSYGPGRSAYVDISVAFPWLMNNGYLWPKDGDGISSQKDTSSKMINSIWGSWEEVAREVAEMYELDLPVATDIVATAFSSACARVLEVNDLPYEIPEWVSARLEDMATGQSEVVAEILQSGPFEI